MRSTLYILIILSCLIVVTGFGRLFAPISPERPKSMDHSLLDTTHKPGKSSPFRKSRFANIVMPSPNPFAIKTVRKETKKWSPKYLKQKPPRRVATNPKPPTYKQLVALEKLQIYRREHVPRDHNTIDRIALKDIVKGQKFLGKIISVTDYGLFVDIGSTKDGLVHIKDTSGAYFIEHLSRHYHPGMYIDVWVKFIDPVTCKLGLQMYDPSTRSEESDIDYYNLAVGHLITGKAVKHTDYGVYIDIGAGENLAYLPVRKMKIPKKQRNWNSWEILPLNTEINCLIHDIDPVKKKICLTTYEIHEWDDVLQTKLKAEAPPRSILDIDAYRPEDFPESNRRKLKLVNTMKNKPRRNKKGDNDDDDDIDSIDEDYDPYADEYDDEEHSEDAIFDKRKDKGGVRGGTLLIDDYDENNGKTMGKRPKTSYEKNFKTLGLDPEDQMPMSELFKELSKDRQFITIHTLLNWDKIKFYIQEGMLDEFMIRKLMHTAGAHLGRLYPTEFGDFIDFLAQHLGLVEPGSEEAAEIDDEIPFEVLPDNEEWIEQVFKHLVEGKRQPKLNFADILQWKAVDDLIHEEALTVLAVERSFEASAIEGFVGKMEFPFLVDRLIRQSNKGHMEHYNPNYKLEDQNKPEFDDDIYGVESEYYMNDKRSSQSVSFTIGENGPIFDNEAASPENSEENTVDGEEDEEDMNREIFNKIANGKDYITLKDLKKWELIQTLLEQNMITESILNKMITKHGSTQITFDQWELFSHDLMKIIESGDLSENIESVSNDEAEDEATLNFSDIAGDKSEISYHDLLSSDWVSSLLKQKIISRVSLKNSIVDTAKQLGRVNKEDTNQSSILKNLLIDKDLFDTIVKSVTV